MNKEITYTDALSDISPAICSAYIVNQPNFKLLNRSRHDFILKHPPAVISNQPWF